ncbi:MAG: proprotein convertase P-domain-containing protein, partial [Flavobacteriaceae bacterium]|nr:proprotein convertase P-domain-containing protein [Flavobacteriaceae bacterium]
MKRHLFLIFMLLPVLVFSQNRIGKIADEIVSTKIKPGKFQAYELFDSGFSKASGTYKNAVRKGIVLDFSASKVATLVNSNAKDISLTLPINEEGETVTLELVQKDIFASSFRVRTSDGRDITDSMDRGKHYRGIVSGKPHSLVSLSIFNNEVMGFITLGEGNYVIGRLQDSNSKHIIYNDRDLLLETPLNCDTPDDGVGYTAEQLQAPQNRDPGDVVCIYIEAGQSVFNSFGGNLANTTNFLNGVFAQSYVLYANEGISMQTSDMLIWTTPDPYNSGTTGGQLGTFQAQTSSINGNLGHLVEVQNIGGLAAGFSGICAANVDNSLCFSGFSGNGFNTVPTFSFNVMIITHEMGHLLGSRHTHACVWNGNNTAIDGCAGFVEGGCSLPPPPPGGGTIMSYCHNNPVGVDFTQGFGPQPGAVVLNTVNTPGNCLLGSCSAPPANDLCANAQPMNCGDTVSGDTTMATFDGVGTCTTSNTAPGVWYSFTAIGPSATLSTCNQAAYDTKISVFSGSCGSLVCELGNDDGPGCSGFTSQVTVPTTPGTTYLVLVHGFGSAVGTFDLTLTCALPVLNDDCTDAISMNCGDTVSGTTVGATFDGVGTCGTSNTAPGVWYTFAGFDGQATLSTCNQASYDSKISVFSGSCGSLVCVGGNDDGLGCSGFTSLLNVCVEAGETYYVLVHGFGSAVGTFDLTLTCTPSTVALTCPPSMNVEGCDISDAPAPFANFTEFQNAGGSGVGNTATFTLINETNSGGFPVTITRTYEISDDCGFTATCDHIIVVEDTTDPVVSCPADIVANNDAGVCGAAVTYAPALATDACGIASVVQTSPDPNVLGSGDVFPVGTTTVTFTATDVNGNMASCSFDITVIDNEVPVIACQDITVELDANGDYNLTPGEVIASATDNCGVATMEFADPLNSDFTECGPSGLPIPATGTSGNMDPSPAVVTTVGIVGVDYAIERIDLDLLHTFDADLDITLTSPNGLVLDLSSDNGGSGDNFTNTVFMDGFPSITTGSAPFTGTFQPEGGPMNPFFAGEPVNGNWTLNIFDDAGGDSGVLNNYCITFTSLAPATVPSIDLTCANVGTNTFTVIVTDVNGNTSSCETEVTVEDNIAPVIACIGEPVPVTDSSSDSPGLPFGAAPTTITSTIDVADDFVITDLDVDLDISHTWVGDIIVSIQSPGGTSVTIVDQPGSPVTVDGCPGQNMVVTLDDEATLPIEDECGAGVPSISGTFTPNNPLSAFDGESTLGTWTITVTDAFPALDDGVLNSWGLSYTHDVTAAPYDAILDGTTGTVTVNANDLLLSVDEACGYSVSFGIAGSPINECGDGLPAAIDENLPPTESTATVAESGILGTDYAIDTVTLDITHTFDGDLDIELISPTGTVLMLSD